MGKSSLVRRSAYRHRQELLTACFEKVPIQPNRSASPSLMWFKLLVAPYEMLYTI